MNEKNSGKCLVIGTCSMMGSVTLIIDIILKTCTWWSICIRQNLIIKSWLLVEKHASNGFYKIESLIKI